jgi:hypothetical protein
MEEGRGWQYERDLQLGSFVFSVKPAVKKFGQSDERFALGHDGYKFAFGETKRCVGDLQISRDGFAKSRRTSYDKRDRDRSTLTGVWSRARIQRWELWQL